MADGLANMKKKIKLNRLAYSSANDTEHVDMVLSRGVNALAAALNVTDTESINKIYESTACLLSLPEYSDKDIGTATVDEWVEALGWQMIKYPRKYAFKWKYWFTNIFDVLDKDHDGYINKGQFSMMYRPTKRGNDKEFLDTAFYSIDTSRTGKVSKEQFIDAYMKYMADPDISVDQYPLY